MSNTKEKTYLIDTLPQYIAYISEMRIKIKEQEGILNTQQRFYFRGQANSEWDIVPSVFRGGFLSNEADLIKMAYLRNPHEFHSLGDQFECLTKLQHYGLPTRLLDVTTNPLVALYFACQKNEELVEDENGNKALEATDGAVFYQRAYGRGLHEQEVRTIVYMATRDFYGDMSLEKCLGELELEGIYTLKEAEQCRKNSFESLISALQKSYFVTSTLSNERLIRQSGAFILPGLFNIVRDEYSVGSSIIQRAKGSLASEFEEVRFVIPEDQKEEILEELDFYNINEASLFPELEHQMTYIKGRRITNDDQQIGQFIKIEKIEKQEDETSGALRIIGREEAKNIFSDVVANHVESPLRQQCVDHLLRLASIDWYLKDSVISSMRLDLAKLLMKTYDDSGRWTLDIDKLSWAKNMAAKIMSDILDKVQEQRETENA